MTVIVGLAEQGRVYLGGDSLITTGTIEQQSAVAKVFRSRDCLMGYCGPVRMDNLLRHAFVPPEHPATLGTEAYLTTCFVDALRHVLKDGGSAAKTNEMEASQGSILLGYRGELYEISYDYSVMVAAASFNAIGSGASVALGAMHATREMGLQPLKRIGLALEAAADLCVGCRGPFVIEEI